MVLFAAIAGPRRIPSAELVVLASILWSVEADVVPMAVPTGVVADVRADGSGQETLAPVRHPATAVSTQDLLMLVLLLLPWHVESSRAPRHARTSF